MVPIPEGVERDDEEPDDDDLGSGFTGSGGLAQSIVQGAKVAKGRVMGEVRGTGDC